MASMSPDPERQAAYPPVRARATHRHADPGPLGLLAFASSTFLISLFGTQPGGVTQPNVAIGCLIFSGGIGQYISGIIEFVTGNTLGATIATTFASYNIAYALIYIPGSGILQAYTDAATGELSPQFSQAVGLFMWPWLAVSVIFTIASLRSSVVFLAVLSCVDLTFLLSAIGLITGMSQLLTAASGTGLLAAFLAYYAGAAGLFAAGTTPIQLPMGELHQIPRKQV